MMTTTKHAAAALAIAATTGLPALAEWSDNPLENLPIADNSGLQLRPKIHPCTDGGCYVSWFDNSSGGYDLRLQRLDPLGEESWAHNGVLVADRSLVAAEDYGLAVDDDGYAVLVFRDDRTGSVLITASRVSPGGALDWGTMGVTLSNVGEYVTTPNVTVASDGAIVTAHRSNMDVVLHRLGPSGNPLWEQPVTIPDPVLLGYSVSDLRASSNGAVILALLRGSMGPALYAQKIASNGAPAWGATPISVFDAASLQADDYPRIDCDDDGGAVFAWHSINPYQCRAQWIAGDGTERFPHNGVLVSTNASNVRRNPSVTHNPQTGHLLVFWREMNAGTSTEGVYGQKIDMLGNRLWTDEGVALAGMANIERLQVRGLAHGDGAFVFWVQTMSPPLNRRILGAKVDADGAFAWSPPIIDISAAEADKQDLDAVLSAGDVALLAWRDGRDDTGDIYAQNVHSSGRLGNRRADVNHDGVVDVLDLLAVIIAWGLSGVPEDINNDGIVNVLDLLLVITDWG
jgi:hypothetical protein